MAVCHSEHNVEQMSCHFENLFFKMQFKDLFIMNFLQIIYSSLLQKAEELKHKAAILEIKMALK